MKTTNIFKLMALSFLMLTVNSCVEDGDYEIPTITIKEPNLKVTHTIKDIRDMYKGTTVDLNKLNGGKAIIEGYVVSSDETGNIYKSIAIQDKPNNPTAAIQIVVDATKTGLYYQVGRKVYVKLKGLGLSDYKGVLQLGKLKGLEVTRIEATDYKQIIIRSSELAKINPLVIKSIKEINDTNVSMLIQLDDMHAVKKDQTYSDSSSKYPVNRFFESCADKQKIAMRNSNYATFASEKIPNKRGSIIAVLGKYGKTYQLFIRNTKDIVFTKNYDCEGSTSGGGSSTGGATTTAVTSLNETFDKVVVKKDITLKGWTTKAVKGDRKWQGKEFKGDKYISIGAYKAKSANIESWIITPGLNVGNAKNKNFTFKSQRAYSKDEILEVLVSTNFDPTKDFSSTTWTKLNPKLAPKSNKYSSFTNAGNVDLSSYSGVIHIAFKYVGNNKTATGTFSIDNVKFNYTK